MVLHEKFQFKKEETQKSNQYSVAEESRERVKLRNSARADGRSRDASPSTSKSRGAQAGQPGPLGGKPDEPPYLHDGLGLLDEISKDVGLHNRILEYALVQPFEAAAVLINDEMAREPRAPECTGKLVRADKSSSCALTRADYPELNHHGLDHQSNQSIEVAANTKAAGERESGFKDLSVHLALQNVLQLSLGNREEDAKEPYLDNKSNRDTQCVGTKVEINLSEIEPWRVVSEVSARFLGEHSLEKHNSSKHVAEHAELDKDELGTPGDTSRIENHRSETTSREQHQDIEYERQTKSHEKSQGMSSDSTHALESTRRSSEALSDRTHTPPALRAAERSRSSDLGGSQDLKLPAQQAERTDGQLEKEQIDTHEVTNQDRRSKETSLRSHSHSDASPVACDVSLPLGAMRVEQNLKRAVVPDAELHHEIEQNLDSNKEFSRQTRAESLNVTHIEAPACPQFLEENNDAKSSAISKMNSQRLVLERDLRDRYEKKLDRQLGEEPPVGTFCTLCRWTDGKVELLGIWTARTVEEFDRHDPEATPTQGALAEIIRIDRAWRGWRSRVDATRARVDTSIYSRRLSSLDRDDIDR